MDNRFPFTEARVRDIPTPDEGCRVEYHDTGCPGLGLRVSAQHKRWCWRSKVHGKAVRIVLGTWPAMTVEAARKKAREVAPDPAKAAAAKRERRTIPTVGEEWTSLLANPVKRRGGAPIKDSTMRIYRDIWPRLAGLSGRRVDEVSYDEVQSLRRRLETSVGASTARSALVLLARLLPNGLPRDPRNGPIALPRIQPRRRFLGMDELRAIMRGLDAEPQLWRVFWLCAVMAPLRSGNLASSRWSDLDLTEGQARWHVAAEDAKGGHHLAMPVAEPLARVLRDWKVKQLPPSEWVFPSGLSGNFSPGPSGHVEQTSGAWKRAITLGTAARFCESLAGQRPFREVWAEFLADVASIRDKALEGRGRPRQENKPKGTPLERAVALWAAKVAAAGLDPERLRLVDLRPHDMRRTAGSLAVQSGISLAIVSAGLGHADQRVTERHYAHLVDAPVRGMMERNAALIASLADPATLPE